MGSFENPTPEKPKGFDLASLMNLWEKRFQGINEDLIRIEKIALEKPEPILKTIQKTEKISVKGEKGEKGNQGIDGIEGKRGMKGDRGSIGKPGNTMILNGRHGRNGFDGAPGLQGERGEKGAPGKDYDAEALNKVENYINRVDMALKRLENHTHDKKPWYRRFF